MKLKYKSKLAQYCVAAERSAATMFNSSTIAGYQ